MNNFDFFIHKLNSILLQLKILLLQIPIKLRRVFVVACSIWFFYFFVFKKLGLSNADVPSGYYLLIKKYY